MSTILLVEDDGEIRENLKRLLELQGHGVSTAANGAEAIDYLRRSSATPKLILLDLMMPHMDGYEFRREQIRDARLAPIPTVVTTALGYVEMKRLTGVQVLRKPLDLTILMRIVEQHCGTPGQGP